MEVDCLIFGSKGFKYHLLCIFFFGKSTTFIEFLMVSDLLLHSFLSLQIIKRKDSFSIEKTDSDDMIFSFFTNH